MKLHRRTLIVVSVCGILVLGGWMTQGVAGKEATKETSLDVTSEAKHPDAEIPAEWGKVVGFVHSGSVSGARDETILLLEANDGTLRRVYFIGGKLKLKQVIRRTSGQES